MMKIGVCFIVIALLVDFGLCKLDDLLRHNVDSKWSHFQFFFH